MAKFRKRPVLVEAERYEDTKAGHKAILKFCPLGSFSHGVGRDFFDIETLKGRMSARPGDWVIRGVKGEFCPVRDDLFRETYEEVADE